MDNLDYLDNKANLEKEGFLETYRQLKVHQENLANLEMMDQPEYQVCQAHLEKRETLEIKDPLESLGEVVKMDSVDPKATLVNQVLKDYKGDKVEMEWLALLVQLVPW